MLCGINSSSSFRVKIFLLGGLAALILTCGLAAQVPTGSIVGTVVDSQGLAIPGAKVVITNQGTNAAFTASTSPAGAYQVLSLDSGLYKVEVAKDGFKTASVTNIKLDAGTQYSVKPVTLAVGAANQNVTVEAGAELVQTTNAQVSDTIEQKQILQLPINGRNPLNLVGMEAGVAQNGATVTTINGQRPSATNVTLDGINIQDNFIRSNDVDFLPNELLIGQVGEATITNQNAGSESGLGSNQISFVTPHGTNDYHGELFWYNRNSAFGANSWFSNAQGVKRGQLNQNQFGGNFGGPILKNKLFFYGTYEGFRRLQSTNQNHTVLTPTALNGQFTYIPTCGSKGNPACPAGVTPGQPEQVSLFNLRPTLAVDPAIKAKLGLVPTGAINNVQRGDSQSVTNLFNTAGDSFNKRNNRTRDNAGGRVDYTLNDRNSIATTFQWNRDLLDRPDLDSTFDFVPVVSNSDYVKFLTTAWRYSNGANFTNEVRYGFNLAPALFASSAQFGNFVLGGLDFTDPFDTFQPQGRFTNTYSWQDNAGWTHGNHTLTFGGQVQRIHVNNFNSAGITPIYNISAVGLGTKGLANSDFTPAGGISTSDLASANNLLATLTGAVGSVNQTFNVTSRTSGFVQGAKTNQNFSLNDISFYGGDIWRVRTNLTATLGLRWEYTGRFDEDNGLTILPVIPAGESPQQAILQNLTVDFAGTGSQRPVYNRDLNNFGPNIGLAWDPWGDGKTAIRAGYSISYINDEAIRAGANASANNQGLIDGGVVPNLQNNSISGNANAGLLTPPAVPTPAFAIPTTFAQNFAAFGVPRAGFIIDPNLRTPYIGEWNLSVEHDLGHQTSITVSYLGNKGTALSQGLDYNQVSINPNGLLADFNRARSNGFLSLAATGSFNPNFNPGIPGSQALTVIPNLCLAKSAACANARSLTSSSVINLIQTGQVGEFANTYFSNNLAGTVPLAPSPFVSAGDVLQNHASSIYHAGTVELRRRFSSGLYLQANYTYSKVLTNSDGQGQTNLDPLLDNAQPTIERARAGYDLTHAFKANFVYTLPFGKGYAMNPSNAWLRTAVSGWSASSIYTWQSGSPYSILSGQGTLNTAGRSTNKNTADSSFGHDDINHLLNVSFAQGGKVDLINPNFIGADGRGAVQNTLACAPLTNGGFCNPAPGTVGTLARNAFTGPQFFNWDFALLKDTPLSENKTLEIRAEAFNFLNHNTFFVGDQNVNSTTFGTINSSNSNPRIMQLAMRIIF